MKSWYELPEAFRRFGEGRHAGKVVITVEADGRWTEREELPGELPHGGGRAGWSDDRWSGGFTCVRLMG